MNIKILFTAIVSMLPNKLKILVMRRLGARIGENCRIGFLCVLDAKEVSLGNNVQIAGLNLMHRLKFLYCGDGSRLNGFNWITGAGTGGFHLGRNSAVTRLHFFEASGTIRIAENTIIAGRGSHFFTHGISSTDLDVVRPIEIGPWCYVGSSSRFAPGAGVGEGSFVGMGSVVTKNFAERYVLIAGSPAQIRKNLTPEDRYFSRPFLPHDHHSPDYSGGRPDPSPSPPEQA